MKRSTFLKFLTTSFLAPHFLKLKSKRVLVLGGTKFLGPAIVESLIKSGHHVTLFNRGVTNPELFPDIKKIRGDRENGIDAFNHVVPSDYDVVIDVWPNDPNLVEASVNYFKNSSINYIYISSIAVYSNYVKPNMNEQSPLIQGDVFEEGNYKRNKKLCEHIVREGFKINSLILRPGAIVGQRDPGLDMSYLVMQFRERQEIILPRADDPVQLIDARDIGNFITHNMTMTHGTFNIFNTYQYSEIINALASYYPNTKVHYFSDRSFLKKTKLHPFVNFPYWIPIKYDPEPGFYQMSNEKIKQVGLSKMPITQILKPYLDREFDHDFIKAGIGVSVEKEMKLLKTHFN